MKNRNFLSLATFLSAISVAMFLSPQSAWAEIKNQLITFSIPPSLNMSPALVKADYVVLEGSFSFAARYEFVYEQGKENEEPTLYVYPDNLNNVPRFFDRGRIARTMIFEVANTKAAGNMLFGKPKTDKLYDGEYPTLQGKATFVMEGVVVSYNKCRRLSFKTDVMRIDNTIEQVSVGEVKKKPDC